MIAATLKMDDGVFIGIPVLDISPAATKYIEEFSVQVSIDNSPKGMIVYLDEPGVSEYVGVTSNGKSCRSCIDECVEMLKTAKDEQ